MLTTIKYLLTYLFLIFAFAFLYCHLGFASQHHFFISQNTQVGGFSDPSDISDLLGWWDATDVNDGSEPSNDTAIGTWQDLSGNGYNLTQGNSSEQPKYYTNIQNSKPIVRFDGGDSMANSSVTFAADTPHTIFVVGSATEGSGTDCFVFLGTTTTSQGAGISYSDSDYYTYFTWGDTESNSSNLGYNSFKLMTAVYDGALGGEIRVDGYSEDTNTLSGDQAIGDGISLGTANGLIYLTGDIAEVIVYTKQLNATEIGQIETYLSSKWGISI